MVNIWNSLPASVISAVNVNTLKNWIDKFWANQEFIERNLSYCVPSSAVKLFQALNARGIQY